MPIAFQPNAFQGGYPGPTAFQTFDRIISASFRNGIRIYPYREIRVRPMLIEHKRTDTVVIEAEIRDPSQVPSILVNADTVQINILRPDGTLEVTLGAMSLISLGRYRYIHAIDADDAVGFWTFNIKATSGIYITQTITQGLFRVVS